MSLIVWKYKTTIIYQLYSNHGNIGYHFPLHKHLALVYSLEYGDIVDNKNHTMITKGVNSEGVKMLGTE